MKKTKKMVAMALAVIMVFGVATTAFASTLNDWEDIMPQRGVDSVGT